MDPGNSNFDTPLQRVRFIELESTLLRLNYDPRANELLDYIQILNSENRDTPRNILDIIIKVEEISDRTTSNKIFNEIFAILEKADPEIEAHIKSTLPEKETIHRIDSQTLFSLQLIVTEKLVKDPLVIKQIKDVEAQKRVKESRVILKKPLKTEAPILKNIDFIFYTLSTGRNEIILSTLKSNPTLSLNQIKTSYLQAILESQDEKLKNNCQMLVGYIDRFIETYPHFQDQTYQQISEGLQPTVDDLLEELATVFTTGFEEVQEKTIKRIIKKIAQQLHEDPIELQKKYNNIADEMRPTPLQDTEKATSKLSKPKKQVSFPGKAELPVEYDKVHLDNEIASSLEKALLAEKPNEKLWNCFLHAATESQSQTHGSKPAHPKTLLSVFIDRSLTLIDPKSPTDRFFFNMLERELVKRGAKFEHRLWDTILQAIDI